MGIITHLIRQNRRWKETAGALANYQGVHWAMDDFRAGFLQLYVPDDERREDAFRGSNYGPFKVRPLGTHPFDAQALFTAAQVAEAYNRKMRALHDHPEWYITTNAEGRIEWK